MSEDVLGNYYFGTYENAVDKQRRVAIPRTWRQDVPTENHFYLIPGRKQSLQLVPRASFKPMLDQLSKTSFADPQASVALASIISMSSEVQCDKQGRIALPPVLMNHAGIKDRVVLLGALTTIQIWSPEIWDTNKMDTESGLDVLHSLHNQTN